MVTRWRTAAQALSGRGGPGRLVAGGLGVSWLCLPLVAADGAATSCATFVIPVRSHDLLSIGFPRRTEVGDRRQYTHFAQELHNYSAVMRTLVAVLGLGQAAAMGPGTMPAPAYDASSNGAPLLRLLRLRHLEAHGVGARRRVLRQGAAHPARRGEAAAHHLHPHGRLVRPQTPAGRARKLTRPAHAAAGPTRAGTGSTTTTPARTS